MKIDLSASDLVAMVKHPKSHDIVWPARFGMSFTKLSMFEQCPHQFEAVHVTKQIKYTDTPESLYGQAVHNALEKYVMQHEPLPHKLRVHQPLADAIISRTDQLYEEGKLKIDLFTECNWAMDATGRGCAYMDPHVWMRGKPDLGYGTRGVLHLIDWKTGKGKYPKPEQIDLLALLAVAQPEYASYSNVRGRLVFLDAGKLVERRVNVGNGEPHLELLRQYMQKSVQILKAAREDFWPKKPSPLCGWCPRTDCENNTMMERLRNGS